MVKKDVLLKVSLNIPETDVPTAPPLTPVRDHAVQMEYGKQVAKQDAASGSIDVAFIMALGDSPLPEEREAHVRLLADQAKVTQNLADARTIGKTVLVLGDAALSVDDPRVGRGYQSTIKQEKSKVDSYEKSITEAYHRRGSLAEILAGKGTHSDNIQWPGDPISAPGPDTTRRQVLFSSPSLRVVALRWVPYLILFPVEFGIIFFTMKAQLDGNDSDWVFPAALSVAFLAGLVFLPGRIGVLGAAAYRRGFMMPKEMVLSGVMVSGWLAAVAGTVYFRVLYDREVAYERAADARGLTLDQLLSNKDIDFNEIYPMLLNVAMWIVPVGVIGLVVIVAKVVLYNPVVPSLLDEDLNIIELYEQKHLHSTILERGKALLSASQEAAEETVREWEHYRDKVLPAQDDEYCAHYRRWLAHYLGNPEVTQALFDQR